MMILCVNMPSSLLTHCAVRPSARPPAAIAVLCKKPEVANKIFTNPELNEFGVYTMSFYQNRQPVQIVVDDRLPVFKGQVTRAYFSIRV